VTSPANVTNADTPVFADIPVISQRQQTSQDLIAGLPAQNLSGPRSFRSACATRITVDVHNASRYSVGVLRSFADKDTERVWRRERARLLDPKTQRSALRKLLILDAAETLDDARIPPGNRLEKLRGDRAGQYSIRVNQQWRICFRWTSAGPEDVEIVDYH